MLMAKIKFFELKISPKMGRFFCTFYLLTIPKLHGIIGRRANGPGAPSFCQQAGCTNFWGKSLCIMSIDRIPNWCYTIITVREGKPTKPERDNNMINIRSILKLAENDGLTLKHGKKVNYKSGWQVATNGVECKTAREAINAVKEYGGNCGVWFANGIYYVDKSKRVQTKKQALEIGKACNQISVYGWARGNLAYC